MFTCEAVKLNTSNLPTSREHSRFPVERSAFSIRNSLRGPLVRIVACAAITLAVALYPAPKVQAGTASPPHQAIDCSSYIIRENGIPTGYSVGGEEYKGAYLCFPDHVGDVCVSKQVKRVGCICDISREKTSFGNIQLSGITCSVDQSIPEKCMFRTMTGFTTICGEKTSSQPDYYTNTTNPDVQIAPEGHLQTQEFGTIQTDGYVNPTGGNGYCNVMGFWLYDTYDMCPDTEQQPPTSTVQDYYFDPATQTQSQYYDQGTTTQTPYNEAYVEPTTTQPEVIPTTGKLGVATCMGLCNENGYFAPGAADCRNTCYLTRPKN